MHACTVLVAVDKNLTSILWCTVRVQKTCLNFYVMLHYGIPYIVTLVNKKHFANILIGYAYVGITGEKRTETRMGCLHCVFPIITPRPSLQSYTMHAGRGGVIYREYRMLAYHSFFTISNQNICKMFLIYLFVFFFSPICTRA